ncbi:MAG: 4Fe-4S dicluster domain-containing protein [Clostridia bacterium]|nr:4Fe-4S dicluster domain-containing protein [Clostridia bacterium]
MAKVTFQEERCKGCGLCETVCPKNIISLAKEKINAKGYHPAEIVNQSECIGCASCAIMCPDSVITVER